MSQALAEAAEHALGNSDPALFDSASAARFLNISIATLYRLNRSRALPRPIRFGRLVRWKRDELAAWVRNGCPKSAGAGGDNAA